MLAKVGVSWLHLVLIGATLLAAGCSAPESATLLDGTAVTQASDAAVPSALCKSADGFSLQVLPDSDLDGGSPGQLSIVATPQAGGMLVELCTTGAQGLKATYVEVSYDASRWHPVAAQASGLLAQGAGSGGTSGESGLIELAVLDQPGRVVLGQVLMHPLKQAGFSGNGVLACVRFAAGAAQAARHASSPPDTTASAPELGWDGGAACLGWNYMNPGDYDQNGLVTISDLTPVGMYFQQPVTAIGRPGPTIDQVDGDNNDLITIADMTPIGNHFGDSVLGGYRVYRAAFPSDAPQTPSGPNGAAAQMVGAVALNQAIKGKPDWRLFFSFPLLPDSADRVFWVRPVDEEGQEGTASNVLSPSEIVTPGYSPLAAAPAYSATLNAFEWYYVNTGDYDQNGVVSMYDSQVASEHFGTVGPFDFASALSVMDTTNHGVINIWDVFTPVGTNMGNTLSGYSLYSSADPADYAFGREASLISPLATVPFSAALGDPAVDRLHFRLSMPAPEAGKLYWVRPMVLDVPAEGVPSDALMTDLYHVPQAGDLSLVVRSLNDDNIVLDFTCPQDYNHDARVTPADGNALLASNLDPVDEAALAAVLDHLGAAVDHFNVYLTADGSEYPAQDADPSTIAPDYTIEATAGVVFGDVLVYDLTDVGSGQYYWVRPVWNDVEGTRSNLYLVP